MFWVLCFFPPVPELSHIFVPTYANKKLFLSRKHIRICSSEMQKFVYMMVPAPPQGIKNRMGQKFLQKTTNFRKIECNFFYRWWGSNCFSERHYVMCNYKTKQFFGDYSQKAINVNLKIDCERNFRIKRFNQAFSKKKLKKLLFYFAIAAQTFFRKYGQANLKSKYIPLGLDQRQNIFSGKQSWKVGCLKKF